MTEPAGVAPSRSSAWARFGLRGQLVAVTTLLAAAVAVALIVIVQVSLAGAANSATHQVLNDRASALVAGIRSASGDGALVVPRARLDPGVAVYDMSGRHVAGSIPPSMEGEFRHLATATSPVIVEGGEHFAIVARPFTTANGNRGVVVIPEPVGPYERNEQAALVVSIIAGVLLVLMASGSAAWISKRVLRPVDQMAHTADEWSERDLERRFDLGPPTNEIRALGHTLDGLLDKVTRVIRAEQRLTSELAHELRTPLTTIQGTADLLAMRHDLDQSARDDLIRIKNACTVMSSTITVLLDLARRESTGHSDQTSLVTLGAELLRMPRPRGELQIDLPGSLGINVPQELAVRALEPVINNAIQICGHASVSAHQRGRVVDILVADSGPGVADDALDGLFTPGRSTTGGSGLGLSLARRVARSGGGEVALLEQHNQGGGATFAVTFPGGAGGAQL